MRLNPQFPADLVTFTEKSLIKSSVFCAVARHMKDIKMGQDKQIKVFKMCVTKFIDKKSIPFFYTNSIAQNLFNCVFDVFVFAILISQYLSRFSCA